MAKLKYANCGTDTHVWYDAISSQDLTKELLVKLASESGVEVSGFNDQRNVGGLQRIIVPRGSSKLPGWKQFKKSIEALPD